MRRSGLDRAIDRQITRQVEAFATSELGLPMVTRYRDVYEFVDEVVLELYAVQTTSDIRWCATWWAHPPAVRRLTMMWASWETHRADNPATGEEVWARVVGDYHFKWLTGSYGPFGRCDEEHNDPPQLRHVPIPTADTNDTDDTVDTGVAGSSDQYGHVRSAF